MKRFIFTMAAACMMMGGMAQTYNYFDKADVDADGWLWFDTQEKIDKYVGFGSKFKIQLQPCGYEDESYQYPEPWADPEVPGYNASGEEGGEGAKFGAIVLNPSSSSSGAGLDNPNGGGFMMWLPDCAQMDVYLSCEKDCIVVGLKAGMGDWVKPVDCAVVKTWMSLGSWFKPLASAYQFQFNNVQSYKNANAPYTTIASPKGTKVTALFTNNGKTLYVHGIRVYTYTDCGGGDEPVKGDVNGDGSVDIADANCCINVILGSEPASKYEGRADVNNDGSVDIGDVNAIINIILGAA